jgi:predicted transcriptional regulator
VRTSFQVLFSTHEAFASLGSAGDPGSDAPPEEAVRAVSIRKSLSDPNYIVSMIDGKPYRSLTRHLTSRGLTPAQYRERYRLPANYPMVAPGYSEQRREMAKRLGLGRKPAKKGRGRQRR